MKNKYKQPWSLPADEIENFDFRRAKLKPKKELIDAWQSEKDEDIKEVLEFFCSSENIRDACIRVCSNYFSIQRNSINSATQINNTLYQGVYREHRYALTTKEILDKAFLKAHPNLGYLEAIDKSTQIFNLIWRSVKVEEK